MVYDVHVLVSRTHTAETAAEMNIVLASLLPDGTDHLVSEGATYMSALRFRDIVANSEEQAIEIAKEQNPQYADTGRWSARAK